ncbi:MAG: lipid-A-disaccharide synthase [Candidatus Aminicenantales bacterium]
MNSVLIVAGENSGEKYGADVVREFKKNHPRFAFFGIGGASMAAAGVELIYPVEALSGVGIFEVLSSLPRLHRLFRGVEREVESRKPRAAVLIDCPDFNLRLAKRLKRMGVPVLYYISPTVWAWRSGRLKTIKKVVDRMLLIFPFEKPLYDQHGIPAVFVGHPLKHKIQIQLNREEFRRKYSLPTGPPLVSLLPGSRPTEMQNHWPILRQAISKMKSEIRVVFLWVVAESLGQEWVKRLREAAGEEERVLTKDGYEAMAYSDLVLSACGTANLEAALLNTPLIAFYRLSPFTYYPFRPLVKIKDYSIVNILAQKRIIPELIQRRFTADRLAEEAVKLLRSEGRRAQMRAELTKLQSLLGEENAARNVAQELAKLIAERAL